MRAVQRADTADTRPGGEDAFVLPQAWRKKAMPRRDGVTRNPPRPKPGAAAEVARLLDGQADRIDRMLAHPLTDADLSAATREHRAGTPNPVGAAAEAALCDDGHADPALFADTWSGTHGLVFAARAMVEYFAIRVLMDQDSGRTRPDRMFLSTRSHLTPSVGRARFSDDNRGAATRIRARLAVADEATYRAAVAALAPVRTTAERRIAAGYLLPTERAWVEESTRLDGPTTHADRVGRTMLLCSAGSAGELEWLREHLDLGWDGWSTELIATLADGTGTAFAWLLSKELDAGYHYTDTPKLFFGALVELASDDAIRTILAHLDHRPASPALLAAARRAPERALRLMAETVHDGGLPAARVRPLLVNHVRAHHEQATRMLPELAPEPAAIVAPLVASLSREAEAPTAALPELLVSPPWTRPRGQSRRVPVLGLVPPAIRRVAWRPGERAEWATMPDRRVPFRVDDSDEVWSARLRADEVTYHEALAVLVPEESAGQDGTAPQDGPAPIDRWRDAVTHWRPTETLFHERDFRPIVARYQEAAIGAVGAATAANPAWAHLLAMPVVDLECARTMTRRLARRNAALDIGHAWLERHASDAARLLFPDALGVDGPARDAAVAGLLVIASSRGTDFVRAAAAEYGEEAVAATAGMFAEALVSTLPKSIPAVPEWAVPVALPQLRLRDGRGALPIDAVRAVLTVFALSRSEVAYPGVQIVKEACDPASLAEFGWQVFTAWCSAGRPGGDNWALHVLGRIGDDETVRRLDPIVRAWPADNAHALAVAGLQVLTDIGTDVALLHLHGIAQRVPFKALRARAQAQITEVAARLGLTEDRLADRLVPDLGLDANGGTVVDYGPRTFTVGFDEHLKPYVLDADGTRLKDLPVPGARDDDDLAPAERRRYAALKKDVRTVAATTLRRLESAMVDGRTWTTTEFRTLFVGHPLLIHVTRRLVWLADFADAGGRAAFRVAEDHTCTDSADDVFALPDDAAISLAHPLHLGDDVGTWSDLFAGHRILQPFPQLARPVIALTDDEKAGSHLARFEGITVPVGRILGLARLGWERDHPQDAGIQFGISRAAGPDSRVRVSLTPGIAVGAVDVFPEQTLSGVGLGHCRKIAHPHTFGDLDPVLAAEILAELTELTSDASA